MSVSSSTVHLHASIVRGASAGAGGPFDGGAAVVVSQGLLAAAGSTLVGGKGSPPFPVFCQFAGEGGDALELRLGATAQLLDCALVPGGGGSAPGCPSGTPGQPVSGPGTAHLLPGRTGTLTAPSPVRAGQPLPLDFSGQPGDLVLLAASARPSPAFAPGCRGTIHPDLSVGVVVGVGVLPASGQVRLTFAVPSTLGALAVPLSFQLALARPGAGCFVGDPTSVLLLDRRF